ncbi:MAG: C40 family peptidase, partial [Candidatus Rokuibacteriota bacterium]
ARRVSPNAMIRRLARVVIFCGVAAALAGCSVVSKQPVVDERAAGDSARGQTVVALARQHVGAPYRWGGSSPSGFDCSGLVRYVYGQVGVSLPHNAAQQYRLGTAIARASLEPGDLVFFDRLRHNGIYVGDGRFIHARQTGRRVAIASLDDAWYASHFVGARRLDPPARAPDAED